MLNNIELLQEMVDTAGVSGYEDGISYVLSRELENIFGKKPFQDVYENILIEVKSQKPGPTLLIAAHMDEIGLIVQSVDHNKEKVFFEKIGNIYNKNLIGCEVCIITPEGILPAIIEENSDQQMVLSMNKKSDISKIKLGYPIFLSNTINTHGNTRLSGKAFDNRIGCFAILEMLNQIDLDEIEGILQIAFLSKAELGFGGIMELFNRPNFILFIDTVESGDYPDSDSIITLGNGIVLPTIDLNTGRLLCTPKSLNITEKIAKRGGVKYQTGAIYGESCLNDTMKNLYNICPNISTALIPIRYHHTSTELFDLNDLNECIKLLLQFIKKNKLS